MTDETGGKPLFCKVFLPEYAEPAVLVPTAALAELIAAAEECAGDLENTIAMVDANMGADVESDMTPVRRLRAAVERVRGS